MSLFEELKRRNVFRVGIAYIVVAWLLAQVVDLVLDNIESPDWVMQVIMLILAIGFPLALFFAWAFEMTPEGIKKEKEVDRSESITPRTGRKLDRVIIGVLVLALGYFAFDKFTAGTNVPVAETVAIDQAEESPVAKSEPASDEKSVAVLAFRDMSAAGDQDYFAEGIAEELLNALVRVKGLRVASRTSAFSYKNSELGLPEIGKQLNVNHILEGSVRTSNDRIRVTAQLIDVNTDTHLWSEIYDRDAGDIFAVQAEITDQVVAELKVHLGDGQPVTAAPAQLTDNTEAYRLYLRGRHLWRTRGRENLITAKSLFEQATELDPQFSRAWSNLAVVHSNLLTYDNSGPVEQYRADMIVTMDRALAIDPQNAEALTVKADTLAQQCQFIEADRTYSQAISIDPMEPTARHWYGLSLLELGQISRARQPLMTGYDLDPLISAVVSSLGNYHEMNGDFEQAFHYYREAALLGMYVFEEGLGRVQQGDYDKGLELMQAGGKAYGYRSIDWLPALIDALRTGDGKDGMARELIRMAHAGEEDRNLMGELLALLNAPSFFEFVGREECGLYTTRPLWRVGAKELRSDPGFLPYLDKIGMTEYFREYGWQDVCTNQNPEVEGCH